MRVFVAGGTGAVGRHTIPALVPQGRTVTALARTRDAVDAAGRHGVAFARVHDGHVRAEIILDPQTYQYLGWRQIVVKDFVPNGTANGKRVTLHVAPGTVFDWTARTAAAIVDRPGQRA
jgi:NAD(P)-dependent dehydrogenase (short-subunit alcohol dehydrogenase family)